MRYIESPTRYQRYLSQPSIFLAGGISGCPDWQQDMTHLLADTLWAVLNPRRSHWTMDADAHTQIAWEHHHLRVADAVLFWFPCETLCPIVLYELGAWSMTDKALYVGTHPNYARRLDVVEQTALVRPDITVVDTLEALAHQAQSALSRYQNMRSDLRTDRR